jgi:hypothetical protein
MGHKQANGIKACDPTKSKWNLMQIGLLLLWNQDAKKGENTTRSLIELGKVLIVL